ncbi:MAG: mechanosensitive ion channel family protein [Deltaproteobacteria bacterium]
MQWLEGINQLGFTVGLISAGAVGGSLCYFIFSKLFTRIEKHSDSSFAQFLFMHCRRPFSLFIPVFILLLLLKDADAYLSESVIRHASQLLRVLLIIAVAWFLVKMTDVVGSLVISRYDIHVDDNLRARKVYTQIQMAKKIIAMVVGILALAAVLMSFKTSRQLGAGILASAGVMGIIIGFAAQRTLANLMAGIQLAITQPIRIDDVVVVEGEWGRIEEIALTYVVVRIWDLRRLILPISYFMEKPFQNWTRVSSQILGTVYLHVDFRVPIPAVRNALQKILEASEYWDGQTCRLHTTEAGDRVVQLRALMSAADSSSAWELRCEVREKLIEFIRKNYPESLPMFRASVSSA